mmetsp:Transcript_17046/g.51554  ORF Transcript_17046/g.51554 Transcript_17046/m.51554 type:complete len:208 (-) Transcript_17046:375-998(-)
MSIARGEGVALRFVPDPYASRVLDARRPREVLPDRTILRTCPVGSADEPERAGKGGERGAAPCGWSGPLALVVGGGVDAHPLDAPAGGAGVCWCGHERLSGFSGLRRLGRRERRIALLEKTRRRGVRGVRPEPRGSHSPAERILRRPREGVDAQRLGEMAGRDRVLTEFFARRAQPKVCLWKLWCERDHHCCVGASGRSVAQCELCG